MFKLNKTNVVENDNKDNKNSIILPTKKLNIVMHPKKQSNNPLDIIIIF